MKSSTRQASSNGTMLWTMTSYHIGFQSPAAAKTAKIAAGTAKAAAKKDQWRIGAHVCPDRRGAWPSLDRVSKRVASAAPTMAITMTVVFIDTANAHPIISPAIALRHFM